MVDNRGSDTIDRDELLEDRRVVTHEVAGEDDDVRLKRDNSAEGLKDVRVVDLGPDMNIAKLNERMPGQVWGQIGDRKGAPHQFKPMGLDTPGVNAGA